MQPPTLATIARTLALLFLAALAGPACSRDDAPAGAGLKVLQLPIRTDGPKSLDPVRGSTVYDNVACSQIFETLLQYKYLKRPLELEPLLLAAMPATTDNPDGTQTWRFRLRQDVHFHDDPCFPGGRGRAIRSDDVFYSWKRLADNRNDPKSWWLFEDTIVGFDEFREAQNAAAKAPEGRFDYDAPVEGMRALGEQEFEVVLKRPLQQFGWKLAMFQTSILPREAVERYGRDFGGHPVGTGPFVLDLWRPGVSLSLNRNPTYHQDYYPSELPVDPDEAATDRERGLDKPAGQRLPIVDRIEYTMFVQDQPMYLQFRVGALGYIETPSEYQEDLFNKRTRRMRPQFRKQGMEGIPVPLLDFIFDGFNMEDPVVGGYTPEKRALRQAISLAFDLQEINETFYNNLVIVYDGPIPPGLDGYPKDGNGPLSYRGPNLEKARELLVKAGYGPGKPLVIDYYTSQGGNNQEQSEMRRRQLARIGVELKVNLVDFSTLIERLSKKGAPMFGYAWGSDYPDAENNLALFFGPNESPGSNAYNYKNTAFDELYKRIQTMPPGPERTALYEQMRDLVIEDCPYVGSMARTRLYAINPWLRNFKPTEDFYNWPKYLDVDESKR